MSALLLRITSSEEPFISPRLFSNRRYALGLGIVFMTTGIGYSLSFLTPTLLSELHGMGDGRSGWVLVPAAVLAALLSKSGGRAADHKGNSFLFFLASTLYMICFLMMSSFSMGAQILIALFLIFGTVGQAFMAISLTKTISLALPKDQSGVGLGLMSMLNFVSGAVFASLYGRMVDQGIGSAWNPLIGEKSAEANTFSNIYLLLAMLMMAVVMIYAAAFIRRSKKLQDASSTG
jgi:DHA2 family metal-tetracycline-proton antiporter-like MFS transporter